MPSTTTTRDWFLWTLSIVFLIAFISFFVQSPGLVGRKGIQPAYLVLQKEAESVEEFVLNRPTILRLLPKLGLDLDLGLDFLCIGGIVASFASFISRDHRNALVIFLQWLFYLSLVQVGQIFLASKWDNLLLEVGFVAMLLAPLGLFGLNDIKSAVVVSQDSHSKAPLKFKFLKMTQNYRLPLWYVKWTLARVVMADGATGLNNLFDGDDQDRSTFFYQSDSVPVRNLYSAYENQILPTPFSWVVGCFPSCVVAIISALHIISHFPVALFVLTPWKQTRLAAFYWLVGTSVTSALLGNQGFYPLLIISLSITLVDDDWFNSAKHLITGKQGVSYYLDSVLKSPSSPTTANGVNHFQYEELSNVVPANSISYLLKAAVLAFLIYFIALVYEVPHLAFFTEKAFITVLQSLLVVLKVLKEHCTLVTALIGLVACCLLVSEIILAFQRQKMTIGCAYLKKMIIHIRFGILFTTTLTLLTCSLVPLVWNTDSSSVETLAPHPLQSAYLWVHKHYHIVNNYATNFRHGFAGDEGRVEIVVEGSNDKLEWKEYNFFFKPSVTSSIPQIIAAHHPRLDESLWFAARSNYKQHTWILNLVYHLLNNQKEVLELFESNPFEGEKPNYIRADLYRYKFNYDLDGNPDWWTREWTGHYLPILSLADPSFVQYVSNSGLLEEEQDDEFSVCHGNNVLASCLSFVRQSLGQTSGSVMCLLLVVLGLLLSMVDPSRATKYHVTLAPENENANQNGHLKDGGKNGLAGKSKSKKDSVLNVPIEILKG